MNIQSLQEGLAQFNRETTTKASELGDTITDMRDKIQKGLEIPAVIGASSKGIKEGGKYVSKLGKGLQSTADKIDSLRGSDDIDNAVSKIKQLPTQIRNNLQSKPNTATELSNVENDTDHIKSSTEMYSVSKREDAEPQTYERMGGKGKGPSSEGDLLSNEGLKDAHFGGGRIPVNPESVESDVGKVAGRVSKVARDVGEGLEAVGETGIPFVSEVADVGAGVMGAYDLFKSIGQGKKIKQEEAQKKQIEDSSPQQQVVVGGKKQQPFSVGGGNLNF